MITEGFSEAAWASCKVVTFSPHVGISIASMFAALVICLLLMLFGVGRKNQD
jgi:hypothetical protein